MSDSNNWDSNVEAFKLQKENLERKYSGMHVAFVDGKFVDSSMSKSHLIEIVSSKVGLGKRIFVQKLGRPIPAPEFRYAKQKK